MKHTRYANRLLCLVLTLLLMFSSVAAAEVLGNSTQSVARIYTEVYIDSAKLGLTEYFMTAIIGSSIAVGKKGNGAVECFVTNSHVINPRSGIAEWCYARAEELLKDDAEYLQADAKEQGKLLSNWANQIYNMCSFECKSYIVFDTLDTAVALSVYHDCYVDSISKDLALVRIAPTTKRKPAVFRDSEGLNRGDTVYTIGFPGVSDKVASEEEANLLRSDLEFITVTKGSVSRLVTSEQCRFVQIDAAINGGNSGGALVDENGYVIGMPTFSYTNSEAANYALASSEIMSVLDQFGLEYEVAQPGIGGLLLDNLPLLIAIVIILIASALVIYLYRKNKTPAPSPTQSRVLICVEGVLNQKRFPLKGALTIGQNANNCQILYPNGTPGVSRLHCTVSFDGSVARVTDLGSSYGTYIGDRKLAPNEPTVIHRGETLAIGSKSNVFTIQ